MKFNWRILIGLVVVAAVAYWGWDSTRARSYSGSELSFGVGSGTVVVNNTDDASVSAQLSARGSRGSFVIASDNPAFPTSSEREGTGGNTVNIIPLTLPSGPTEFRVTRGSNVIFTAAGDQPLEAVVHPLSESETNMTLIAAGVVILGALFYISSSTGHAWLKMLRRRGVSETQPATA
jgi:hypothetical protein